jgi:hypothetical protein
MRASSAIPRSSTAAAMNVTGSEGLTAYRSPDSRRVSARAAAMPASAPKSAIVPPSRSTILSTCPCCAPSAMRMPLSFLR